MHKQERDLSEMSSFSSAIDFVFQHFVESFK